ncbi:hypothetical protein [Rubrobacter calidifluminis]|uniref:hypothetical protein n=1 Tax=Rubrobacter calidifluminis TaxID=1392640 RepID=UPI00235F9A95|nr:hypothetical protein [Rubrobacter calidifluminis]
MQRIAEKIAARLPLLFVVVPIAVGVVVFFIDETRYLEVSRIVVYVLFAIAATVLAIGHFRLLGRSEDGKASVWLIAFAYSKMFLAAALWAVALLVTLSVSVGPIRAHELLVAHILYAFVAAAMAGTVLSASVFAIGYRLGRLNHRIWPYPWRRDGRD